ncbi:21913_t:CDS:2 [Cetraspora pellucida]|uniref:21913_t:CDS:1 n=1 Tax=Cetraspora pellucida TaxID=1433469 RepID=A0A9N9C3Z0_9GLOM|nr:21913_t:CDS:2 [Cetraspora pellucida]
MNIEVQETSIKPQIIKDYLKKVLIIHDEVNKQLEKQKINTKTFNCSLLQKY